MFLKLENKAKAKEDIVKSAREVLCRENNIYLCKVCLYHQSSDKQQALSHLEVIIIGQYDLNTVMSLVDIIEILFCHWSI